jgi:hypothetical protein
VALKYRSEERFAAGVEIVVSRPSWTRDLEANIMRCFPNIAPPRRWFVFARTLINDGLTLAQCDAARLDDDITIRVDV